MLDISGLKVLYEDNHLIAVNKPGGWLVQGDKTGDIPLSEYVKQYIKKRYKKPGDVFLGVIHRLDRPVSGVVVFARTSKALTRMNKLFHDREVDKLYWAITNKKPDPLEGELVHFLAKHTGRNVTTAYTNPKTIEKKKAKRSVLNYKMIARLGGHVLIEVNPITGRSHQIRVQLSEIGCPIRGDLKYGFNRWNEDSNINLHCRKLSFIHPVKKERITIKADPKRDSVWLVFEQYF